MRRLIVQEFVTIDGLAAGPGGEVAFIPAATVGDSGVECPLPRPPLV